ncbi:hypothetical protein ABVN80_00725 [Acinetobacter baumannii]
MVPITLLLCKNQYEYDYWWDGCKLRRLAGATSMTSQSGIIFRSLMENTGITSQTAFSYSSGIVLTLIIPIAVFGEFTPREWKKVIQL